MSPWGWRPVRTQGVWQHGALWLKPLALVAPWASAVMCILLLHVVGNTFALSEGVLFELPNAGIMESLPTDLVALVLPGKNGTAVIFDDVRYSLDDGASTAAFGEHLAERVKHVGNSTLLVLADRRTGCGEMADLAAIARMNGVERILIANRKAEARLE